MIVYKYKLKQDALAPQDVMLPYNAIPLQAGEQHGELHLWCMIPHSKPAREISKRFYVFGTGIQNDHVQLGDIERLRFLNTVQMSSGLVWHIFVA